MAMAMARAMARRKNKLRVVWRAAVILVVFAGLGFLFIAARKSIVPPYEIITTSNGVPVYWFPSPNIPLFEARLVFKTGALLDPPGKSGLGMLTAAMLKKGVPGLDEDAISRKLDDLAGSVDFWLDDERTSASAYGLNEHADEILSLMFRQLSSPNFPEKPFARMRTNHIEAILQLPDSAGGLASYILNLLLFNGTERTRPSSGFVRDLKSIRLEEIAKHYPRVIRTDRLRALVIGGKDRTEVVDKAIKGIEALPCVGCGKVDSARRRWSYDRWRVPPGQAVVLERSGITEAHVRMGFVGPKRRTPEFYDLRVAETILSGPFGSRLNQIIREKLSLAYGVNAGFDFDEETGSFSLSTSTQNEKVGKLILELRKLLAEFATGQVAPAELAASRDYLTGAFPLGLQNIYVIAGSFFGSVLSGLEPDSLDMFQHRVSQVSAESMRAAIVRHFHMNEMITVIVGDTKAMKGSLEKAGIKHVVREPKDFL